LKGFLEWRERERERGERERERGRERNKICFIEWRRERVRERYDGA
jgi:hypothetical protein